MQRKREREGTTTMRRVMTVAAFVLLGLSAGCGASDNTSNQEQLANSDQTAQGIVCDQFELRWELDGTDLLLAIDTDLPDEGELSVSVRRAYSEVGSDSAYSRDYFSEFEAVSRWREPRRIALDADAWKADLTAHQNEMAALGDDLAFEIASIENSIEIKAVLHLNQDDPRFGGSGNPNLSGEATSRRGDSVLVEAEASIDFPLDGPPPPTSSSRVLYDGLVAGESYRLSQETPLMPEREPADPLEALERVVELPEGSVIRVIATEGSLWYEVVLVGREGTSGVDQ